MKFLAVNSIKYKGNYFNQSPVSNKAIEFEDISESQKDISRREKNTLQPDILVIPTYSSLEKISGSLSEILSLFFAQLGICTDTPVNILADQHSNEIGISGEREDADIIQKKINSNEDLKDKILTVSAIASHVCQMPEHLAFQKEYFESDNPEQVLANYSHLFNDDGSDHNLIFRFNSGKLEIYYDGKLWSNK